MAESEYINQWQISIEETTILSKFVSSESRRFYLVHHNSAHLNNLEYHQSQVQRGSRCRIFILHHKSETAM